MTLPVRFSLTFPLAAGITFVLFAIMQALIAVDRAVIDKTPAVTIEWVKHLELEPLAPSRERVRQVPPPEVPPAPPRVRVTEARPGPAWVDPHLLPQDDGVDMAWQRSDGPALPIVRIQPAYPRSALARGVEGYTIVEFDVWTDGSVRNARIVEHFPGELFDQVSLNAIERFRYEPKVENGRPVIVTGMQNRFTFELTATSP